MVAALADKRAIVTGAASGIGRAAALALAASGACVVGIDKQQATIDGVTMLAADLSDEAAVIAAVACATESLGGGIDILVNCAGLMRESPLAQVTAQDIDLHFAANVRSTILVAREALKHMGDGARIINVASELAYLGRQNASVYSASKAAVLGLTRSWARELAPRILVNAVAPGPTDTPLLGFQQMTADQQALELAHPLARLGRPEEIADAVVFLAGPGATFVTGHCLGVNGGAAMS